MRDPFHDASVKGGSDRYNEGTLKTIVGGEGFITDLNNTISSALINAMRRAKKSGQTFEQFVASLFHTSLPEEILSGTRQFWNSL